MLVIDQEMSEPVLVHRFHSVMEGAKGVDFIHSQGWQIDDEEQYEQIRDVIVEKKYGVVVFDTFVMIHGKNENEATEMREINKLMLRLIHETGVTIIFLHHEKKPYKGDNGGQASSRGSTEIMAKVSSYLSIQSKAYIDEEKVTVLEMVIQQPKSRSAQIINPLSVLIKSKEGKTWMEYGGETVANIGDRARKDVYELLKETKGEQYTKARILETLKERNIEHSGTSVDRALKNLSSDGVIKRLERVGNKGHLYWWTDEDDKQDELMSFASSDPIPEDVINKIFG